MDIVFHLKKMEEILRTTPRQNTLSGLVIIISEPTAQLWRDVIVEILKEIETPPNDEGAK